MQRKESENEINKTEMHVQQFEKWFMDLYIPHGDVSRDFGQGILISSRFPPKNSETFVINTRPEQMILSLHSIE